MKQRKRWIQKLSGLTVAGLVVASCALMLAPAVGVSALDGASDARDAVKDLQTGGDDTTVEGGITDLVNVLLFALGAVAVIMIIFGGFRMVTSNGNADQIKSGKNTIMYAVIGLIVAILAYAIVNFVVNAFMT